MNPRGFCREQSYHKALMLTYSFDPIFFEQVVLPDLWAGRSSDILVIGDQTQIDVAMESAAGQLWHLGKHYLLEGAAHRGAFHPKVFLRLGPKDGVVMIGSGNVTSSGWGGNHELGAAWMVGPGHTDLGRWLHPFLDSIQRQCSSELAHDAVLRFKDIPWFSLTPAATEGPLLYSHRGRALGPALAQRWGGRRFDEVKMLTGSTDEAGSFLRWAHETFGVTRATIGLTPSSASFDPEKIADLPLEVLLIAAPHEKPMHAKFYWFDGPGGPAAVVGSANCSAAAWLLRPDSGGNVEALVVYDQPEVDGFENVLSVFDGTVQSPSDVLVQKPGQAAKESIHLQGFVLKSLIWDAACNCVRADISPAPGAFMSVELILDGKRLPLTRSQDPNDPWLCEVKDGLGPATVFASVVIQQDDNQWGTVARWINDIAKLEHASNAARLLEPFKGLERKGTSSEQRRMLDELHDIAQSLFNETASFRDPGFGRKRAGKTDNDEAVAPVNPNDLIVHLGDVENSLPHISSVHQNSLSLTGILRLLFATEEDKDPVNAAANDHELDEGHMPGENDDSVSVNKPEQDADNHDQSMVEERLRERLANQIDNFLKKLSSTDFAARCTATQMVQAVSFPLAVAIRGLRHGWVTRELAESWALKVCSILFRGKRKDHGGLLHAVEQRYTESERYSTFKEVVGDGTLWVVLVAMLGNAKWQGVSTDIDKAVALREVFTAQQLLSFARPEHVKALLRNIRLESAQTYVAVVAPTATKILNDLEEDLRPIWKEEVRRQNDNAITHRVGDLLWRDSVGWAVCLRETQNVANQPIPVRLRGVEKKIMPGFYVNATELALRDQHLLEAIGQLSKSVSTKLDMT